MTRKTASVMMLAAALFAGAAAVFASAAVAADYQKGAQLYQNREYSQAYAEFLPLAKSGHALAQFMIAVMYDAGYYVKRDGKVAAGWYRQASEQGHPDAQIRLAGMLYTGTGVQPDRETAYMWASLATDRLHGEKQEKAASFARSVAMLLSQTQLERANAAIAAWHPRIGAVNSGAGGTQRLLRTGTGFFLNASGTLLTNQHVVYACQRINVSYGDRTVNGTLLDVDFGADLATVKTDIRPTRTARFSSEPRPKPGALVSVSGYAVNRSRSRDILTSSGRVLDAGIAFGNAAWLQTSVPIYRGQSGSPVLDSAGLVAGTARGVFQDQLEGASQVTADGQATVVGVDSISRFLARTHTPFNQAMPGHDVSAAGTVSPSGITALLECWGR